MIKVAYNVDFGGFSLSEEAVRRYCELKGLTLEIEENKWGNYYIVDGEDWNSRHLQRHDPILVQVIEELGEVANGKFADIVVEEIEGSKYYIEDYDGAETLRTPENMKWIEVSDE